MVLGDGLLLGLPPYFLAIPSIATSQQLKRLLNGSADKLLYDHTMTYNQQKMDHAEKIHKHLKHPYIGHYP